MSDINFVTSSNTSDTDNSKKKREKKSNKADVLWTKPENEKKESEEKSSNMKLSGSLKPGEMSKKKELENDRPVPPKYSKATNAKETVARSDVKEAPLGLIGRIFKRRKRTEKTSPGTFANEKEIMAKLGEKKKPLKTNFELDGTKEKFKAEKKEEVKNKEKVEKEDDKKAGSKKESPSSILGGLRGAIKGKLQSGKNGSGEEGILKTNLIKGEIVTYIDWKGNITILIISIFLSGTIIALIYGGLILKEQRYTAQNEELKREINNYKFLIDEEKKKTAVVDAFQRKLSLARALLNNHIYWTNLFKFFESNILSDVSIQGGFSGSLMEDYSFPATAPDYSTVDYQVAYLRNNDQVIEVSVDGCDYTPGAEGGEVNFNLDLSLDEKLFYKGPEEK